MKNTGMIIKYLSLAIVLIAGGIVFIKFKSDQNLSDIQKQALECIAYTRDGVDLTGKAEKNCTAPELIPQSEDHLASIVGEPGEKNIRNGPGTNYDVIAKINIGDRVQILEKAEGEGKYIWYRVSLPSSNTQGWIAAQFIQFN